MADQVNLTGSLAPGSPLTFAAVAVRPQPSQDRSPATRPAAPQPAAKAEGQKPASAAAVDSAAREVITFLQQNQSDLVFQVDKATGEPYFKIVDSKTKEVIRQVPSEDILVMARKLRELADPKAASGVLVDKEG